MCFTWASFDDPLAVPIGVPWQYCGRNAAPQLFTPPWASVGQIVTKEGRFRFSLPNPYTTQDPMLGRTKVSLPVCSFSIAPPWAGLVP